MPDLNTKGEHIMSRLKKLNLNGTEYDIGDDSGASGHTIQNENGTDFTARTNLQFLNAVVRDDPTNDRTIVETIGGEAGLPVGDVINPTIRTSGTSIFINWQDPNDFIVSDVTLAEWIGTVVVIKEGSEPQSRTDGTLVMDNTTRRGSSASEVEIPNLNYGTRYYVRFFPYTAQGVYTRGSSVNTIPAIASLPIPTYSDTMTYDGTEQTAEFDNQDLTHTTVTGNTATNAGAYTATFTLNTGYKWANDTVDDISIEWTINKQKLNVPTITADLTYNGSEQHPTVSTYDDTKISVTGIDGTDADTYTATIALIDKYNYLWTDDTTTNVTVDWTIKQADGNATLSTNSVTLDPDHLTATVTISNETGTIGTPTTSDSSVATASLSDHTVTISSVNSKSGTVTISIPIGATKNYKSATVTISVDATFLAIVTWANGTDAQIAAMLEAHYNGSINIYDHWKVGDERVVNLSAMSATGVGESHAAQSVTLVLSNVGGKTLATPVSGKTTCAFQVDQKHSLNETGYMNSTNTNTGGWKSSARRTWCNSVYKNAIPSTLRGIFKEFINQSGTGGGSSSGTENTTDTFALRAEIEVFGSTTYSVSGEGSQVTYYQTSSNRIKNVNGSATAWWERSPRSGTNKRFCRVSSNGTADLDDAVSDRGLAPFGCI